MNGETTGGRMRTRDCADSVCAFGRNCRGAVATIEVQHNHTSGIEILSTLSKKLTQEYGRGFDRTNLFAMFQCAEVYSDCEIVQTLSGQLPDERIVSALSTQLCWSNDRQKRACS